MEADFMVQESGSDDERGRRSSWRRWPQDALWIFLAIAIAGAWLLPFHNLPWAAFSSDAWISAAMLLLGIMVLRDISDKIPIYLTSVVCLSLLPVVCVQYFSGIVPFAGQAWISATYLLGFCIAQQIGGACNAVQSNRVLDALFLAIVLASIASVAVQLAQWSGIAAGPSIMELRGNRPYANLGQPNQLATLLLWGVLACIWICAEKKIRLWVPIGLLIILFFGISLTQSRTAWLAIVILMVFAVYWRGYWYSRKLASILVSLLIFFVLCNWALPWFSESFGARQLPYVGDRFTGDVRWNGWRMFVGAILQKPWLGYGFTEVAHAQLSVSLDYPPLGGAFGQAHNIILEIFLWFGIPIGIVACGTFAYWFIDSARSVKSGEDALLLCMIFVVGNHALTELPLHYAYFLLPVGLLIGVINSRKKKKALVYGDKRFLVFLYLCGVFLFVAVVNDYLRVERNFNAWLIERDSAEFRPSPVPPKVLLLTQLREKMRFARMELATDLTDEQLDWMRNLAEMSPSAFELHKLATAFAMSGHAEEAAKWLRILCHVTSLQQCTLVEKVWAQQSLSNENIAKVGWPK